MFRIAGVALSVCSANLLFATFDGAPKTTFQFVELNDPVMGGESTGTWTVNKTGQYGIFDGEVVNVPSLGAPGFIKTSGEGKYANASAFISGNLVLNVRTTTPEYKGYRVSFFSGLGSAMYSCAGGGSIPFSRGCFKAKFSVNATGVLTTVRIPFNEFSDLWSPATGEQTTTCAQDKDACPTAELLSKITTFEIWAEGANGKVHLEVVSIGADTNTTDGDISMTSPDIRPPSQYDSCSGAVQPKLLYGISGRTTAVGLPVQVGPNETLAEAVCCDSRMKTFAEPQFLFAAPDIDLFARLDKKMPTTFFDSVCGLPLFTAPLNRTMDDFMADTKEHGWPSFRSAEVISDNLVTDPATNFVMSKCGTHLGTYLPDAQGPRWCIDLSCISGMKA